MPRVHRHGRVGACVRVRPRASLGVRVQLDAAHLQLCGRVDAPALSHRAHHLDWRVVVGGE